MADQGGNDQHRQPAIAYNLEHCTQNLIDLYREYPFIPSLIPLIQNHIPDGTILDEEHFEFIQKWVQFIATFQDDINPFLLVEIPWNDIYHNAAIVFRDPATNQSTRVLLVGIKLENKAEEGQNDPDFPNRMIWFYTPSNVIREFLSIPGFNNKTITFYDDDEERDAGYYHSDIVMPTNIELQKTIIFYRVKFSEFYTFACCTDIPDFSKSISAFYALYNYIKPYILQHFTPGALPTSVKEIPLVDKYRDFKNLCGLCFFMMSPAYSQEANISGQIMKRIVVLANVIGMDVPDGPTKTDIQNNIGCKVMENKTDVVGTLGHLVPLNHDFEVDVSISLLDLYTLEEFLRIQPNSELAFNIMEQLRLIYTDYQIGSYKLAISVKAPMEKFCQSQADDFKTDWDNLNNYYSIHGLRPYLGLQKSIPNGQRVAAYARLALIGWFHAYFSLQDTSERENWRKYKNDSIKRHIGTVEEITMCEILAKTIPSFSISSIAAMLAPHPPQSVESFFSSHPEYFNMKSKIYDQMHQAHNTAEWYLHEKSNREQTFSRVAIPKFIELLTREIQIWVDDLEKKKFNTDNVELKLQLSKDAEQLKSVLNRKKANLINLIDLLGETSTGEALTWKNTFCNRNQPLIDALYQRDLTAVNNALNH